MRIKARKEYTARDSKGRIRPLWQDWYRMGTRLASNVMILHTNHPDQPADMITIVNTETGESVDVIIREG